MILIDSFPLQYSREMVTEAVNKNGSVVLRNVKLQSANKKNQNGRIYPRNILLREATKYNEQFVKQRRALGELDHPDRPVVNLSNVSHNITEMWWSGDDLYGNLEILTTPQGNIVKELMKNGIRLGISSRGAGSVKKIDEATVEVDEDFSLICWDLVANPSTYGAFINESILPEKHNKMMTVNKLISDFFTEIK